MRQAAIRYQGLWRLIDIAIALPLFLLTLPAYLIIPPLHKIFSREKSIFKQWRMGRVTNDTRNIFEVEKFCTMYGELDRAANPSKKGVTPIGRLLRPIGIDEIPQIGQILSGQMSVFGPRPWSVDDYDVIQKKLKITTTIERNRDVTSGILSPGGVLLRYPHTPQEIRKRIAMDIRFSRQLNSQSLVDQSRARLSALAVLALYGPRMIWRARLE